MEYRQFQYIERISGSLESIEKLLKQIIDNQNNVVVVKKNGDSSNNPNILSLLNEDA